MCWHSSCTSHPSLNPNRLAHLPTHYSRPSNSQITLATSAHVSHFLFAAYRLQCKLVRSSIAAAVNANNEEYTATRDSLAANLGIYLLPGMDAQYPADLLQELYTVRVLCMASPKFVDEEGFNALRCAIEACDAATGDTCLAILRRSCEGTLNSLEPFLLNTSPGILDLFFQHTPLLHILQTTLPPPCAHTMRSPARRYAHACTSIHTQPPGRPTAPSIDTRKHRIKQGLIYIGRRQVMGSPPPPPCM
jgi:hypothetical protein